MMIVRPPQHGQDCARMGVSFGSVIPASAGSPWGRIVASGSPAELKKQIAGDIITLGYGTADRARAASSSAMSAPPVAFRSDNFNSRRKRDARMLSPARAAPWSYFRKAHSLKQDFWSFSREPLRSRAKLVSRFIPGSWRGTRSILRSDQWFPS